MSQMNSLDIGEIKLAAVDRQFYQIVSVGWAGIPGRGGGMVYGTQDHALEVADSRTIGHQNSKFNRGQSADHS
jgi:hypothetical protein